MILRRASALLLLLAVSLAGPLRAEETGPKAASISIVSPWARATPGGATVGAAYAEIVNSGADADRLTGIASPAAGRVEIHTHVEEGGVMMMRKMDSLEIAGGASSLLKPGGNHIMLMDLKGPLKAGDSFKANFTFEKAGVVEVNIPVGAIGSSGPPSDSSGAASGAGKGQDHGSDQDHHKH